MQNASAQLTSDIVEAARSRVAARIAKDALKSIQRIVLAKVSWSVYIQLDRERYISLSSSPASSTNSGYASADAGQISNADLAHEVHMSEFFNSKNYKNLSQVCNAELL